MFLMATVVAVSMININTVPVHAITQDEMIAMVRERNEQYGIDSEHCKSTGGTANDSLTVEELKKIEEVNSNQNQLQ